MAFVYEKLTEEDKKLFHTMKIKNYCNNGPKAIPQKWCADKENNAYLIGIGGGNKDMPYFYDLWWNGTIVRMEIKKRSYGDDKEGYHVNWGILRIPIPHDVWEKRQEIVNLLKDAFSKNCSWCEPEYTKSISVNINCEPECIKECN